MDILTEPTPNAVIQTVLAHPDHLVTKTELNHYVAKSKPEIQEAIDGLKERNILAEYRTERSVSPDDRKYPTVFFGPTPNGIQTLKERKFLRGVPVLRATFDALEKTETLEYHLHADRPSLPESVNEVLHFEPDSTGN
jgi:hypothetical protein